MTNSVADFPWDKTHVTDTVTVAAYDCVLHNIVLNGLTTAGDVTVYDGVDATGNIIAVLHLDPATSISVQPITFSYDCKMDTGIHVVYDETVACDLTVTYR